MRCCDMPIRMAKKKKKITTPNVGENAEKLGHS